MDEKNNTGNSNAGNRNTGNSNAGNWNTGYSNAGYSNAGNWNAGYRNTGNSNAGDWNAGNRNTGNSNAGDWNTGDWNTGDWNTGYFNTDTHGTVRAFNKDCPRDEWENSEKPDFLYFSVTEWIFEYDMSDQEKIDNPTFHTTGGYLKSYEYQEAFQKSWNAASEEDRKKVESLPNFDADIFLEISGIDIRTSSQNPQEIVIDGATYVLKD